MDYKVILTALLLLLIPLAAKAQEDEDDQDSSLIVVDTEDEQNVTKISVQYVDKVDGYDPDMEPFVPTKEWQTIKPDQSIPRGLHVRMNLQTGKKEAKLMDEEEETTEGVSEGDESKEKMLGSDPGRLQRMKQAIERAINDLDEEQKQGVSKDNLKYWKEGGKEGIVNTKKDYFTPNELKNALKKFKASKDDVQEKKDTDAVKKFRSIDELKEDFKKLKMDMKTDLEILTELLSKYRGKNLTTNEHVDLLTDLEYYVHQIDNADNFVNMGGLELLKQDLNNTEENIREEAISVFGSATQNNPKVQIKVLDAGVLQQLIHMLSIETKLQIQSRLLYSISSLIRHFPFAQERFLQLGGLQALANLFMKPETEKLRVKAVTLVNDLFLERKLLEEHGSPDDSVRQEKLNQYNRTPLPEAIREQGWCDLMTSLLVLPDHDTREKVFTAMETFIDLCKGDFSKSRPMLQNLRSDYVTLSLEEKSDSSEDTYFNDILAVLDDLLRKISPRDEL